MSLSKQLREAAIARAVENGHVIDSFVLAPDGVIDLRALDSPESESDASRPDSALGLTLGGFRTEIELDHLYDDDPKFGWKRLRRNG